MIDPIFVAGFIQSFFLALFIITVLGFYAEVKYNVKYKNPTEPYYWILPGIMFGAFWFVLIAF